MCVRVCVLMWSRRFLTEVMNDLIVVGGGVAVGQAGRQKVSRSVSQAGNTYTREQVCYRELRTTPPKMLSDV